VASLQQKVNCSVTSLNDGTLQEHEECYHSGDNSPAS